MLNKTWFNLIISILFLSLILQYQFHVLKNSYISYKRYSARDYAAIYNALLNFDWSSLYNETSVDAAVDWLNVAVTQAVDLAVPSSKSRQSKVK
jgi:hypothetical protein